MVNMLLVLCVQAQDIVTQSVVVPKSTNELPPTLKSGRKSGIYDLCLRSYHANN